MLLSVNRSTPLGTSVTKRSLQSVAATAPKLCRQPSTHSGASVPQWNKGPEPDRSPQPAMSVPSFNESPAFCPQPGAIDPFYLFACYLQWEQAEESSAAWELLAAAQSSHEDTRAHARSLLASSRHLATAAPLANPRRDTRRNPVFPAEIAMNVPYGLEIIEACSECTAARRGFFCDFSQPTLDAWDQVTLKSTLPAGAILFVEGQNPRGMFVLCSGRVNLSTTSKDGKLLLLKTAEPGEVLGLSATISGMGYEVTAETATPCQVNFIDRNHTLALMQTHTEFGIQAARCLSRGFHEAYRDIHDLMLSKTSAGKLARLLLSQSPLPELDAPEIRIASLMTHEEMAHRIGASRETVTRLLTDMKRKQLIRLDGPTLVIRDRTALEALTV